MTWTMMILTQEVNMVETAATTMLGSMETAITTIKNLMIKISTTETPEILKKLRGSAVLNDIRL
jgi:hypothetical protein